MPSVRPARPPWPLLLLCAALAGCGQEDPPPAEDSPPEGEAPVTCPSAAPTAAIVYPEDGAPHTESFIEIHGTATDAEAVQVTVDDEPPLIAAGGNVWRTTVQLPEGAHRITVRALSRGDCPDGPSVTHSVVQGRRVTLLEPPPGNEVELRLDRLALEELLPPEAQAQITLTRLDLRPLVLNALAALEDPDAWGFDISDWGDAEHNLASLLVMSPDSANLDGTGLAALMRLSGQLGLPPARILSDMLRLPIEQRFLAPEIVADVMIDNLIGTHPAFVNFDGTMPVTLYDGLADLEPLLDTYGPSGTHPGFLAAPPSAELFTPAFAMIVRGRGNVNVRPGLLPGRGFKSHVDLPPEGTAILELDFQDPATFQIVGLHPEPRAQLTLEVQEFDGWVPTLGGLSPGHEWTLEAIVGEASRRAFSGLWPDGYELPPYDLGNIENAASIEWDDGFVTVSVVADLGPPPEPSFIWDLILEVAQARMHDGADGPLDEGDANVLLALPPLPIGLTAEQLVDTMRPVLEDQREQMVDLMVGEPEVLPSEAALWLADDRRLQVASTAPALYASADALATNDGPVREVRLDGESRRFWTRSPAGETVVLDIGPWAGDRVVIGETIMPEGP